MVTHRIQISQQGEVMSHMRYLLPMMKALAVLLVSITIRASISIHLERVLTGDYKGLFFIIKKKKKKVKSRIRPSINETQNLKTGFTNWVGMNLRNSLRVPNTVVHASNKAQSVRYVGKLKCTQGSKNTPKSHLSSARDNLKTES